MTSITYRLVSDVDFEAFTAAFNHAYSDYFVPIIMTADAFRALMQRDDLLPETSVVALDGDHIVGMGILGLRPPTGWIGGMGVIPGYRRQGIGRQIMGRLLDHARDHNLGCVKLEVIEANTGAYALYQQFGFQDHRHLLYLQRDPAPLPTSAKTIQVERYDPANLLAYYDRFHDIENPWQRMVPSLNNLVPHMRGWAALNNGDIVGYALGWTDYHQIRLSDLATSPAGDRASITQALLIHLHDHYPEAHGLSINVADDDPGLAGYKMLGYAPSLRQIEMRLGL